MSKAARNNEERPFPRKERPPRQPRSGHEDDRKPLGPMFKGQFRFSLWYVFLVFVAMIGFNYLIANRHDPRAIDYSEFKERVRSGEIRRVELGEQYYVGYGLSRQELERQGQERQAPPAAIPCHYRTNAVADPGLIPLLDERGVQYAGVPAQSNPLLGFLLYWVLPIAGFALLGRLLFQRMGSHLGSSVLSLGKNRAQIVAEGETGVGFVDVAGADEAKAELVEVVDFLKRPERYTAIGGRIPKGILLVGAPGTGKTLLAKAVAGEAGVTFFRLSGAEFVEMFVGVGAARVRDLFAQARQKAPCIIFIDELDALGKSRTIHLAGNDEREQTLNQLLVEMDGFDSRTGVIILAATNRPEVLDPALLRPGRFDRQVLVDKPDAAGREAILRIHARGVRLAPSVDLARVARSTPGFVGADLANLVNEAALLAVRAGRQQVGQGHFEAAIEKLVAGLERKSRLISPRERRIVACHEAGHALTAWFTEGAEAVGKVSIVPRGMGALGYTLQTPAEERYLLTEGELAARIDVLLGGRAAEQIVFQEVSTGAANDLVRAADIARRMITDYGLSERFRNVHLPSRRESPFLGPDGYAPNREYSEGTQQYIDEQMAQIIRLCYERVTALLQEKLPLLRRIAEKLLEEEVLDASALKSIIRPDMMEEETAPALPMAPGSAGDIGSNNGKEIKA